MTAHEIMHIRPFLEGDQPGVVSLWEQCGLTRPWNDPINDIYRKLKVQPHMFLVGTIDGEIVGSIMAGYDGHRGWINYLAVAPQRRHCGYGRLLMQAAEELLREIGCPKINVQIRTDNKDAIEFYRRLGYGLDDVVGMGKRLQEDG